MQTIIADMTNQIDEKEMAQAGKILKEGGLVAFPTETVYGLGANALARKTATAFVLRNQRFRHNQCFSIYTVEFVYDFTALFDHRKLILTYRYSRCLKRCDICCLADRISKESYRNTCLKITHLNLRFNRWVSLKTGYRNQIHILKRKFCQFRYL